MEGGGQGFRGGENPGGSVYSPTGTEVFLLVFCLFCYLAVLGGLWNLSSLAKDGLNLHPRQEKYLTTGPPGNSQYFCF